jgi:hypothetical protein
MSGPVVTQADRDLWDEILYIWRMEFDPDGHRAIARHREQSTAAKDAEIVKLQEIVRTQAEEAAKPTYYYTDKMDELKQERDALAGALQDCLDTLRYTRAFMLKKHGTTNPTREDAIAAADAALAQHKGDV